LWRSRWNVDWQGKLKFSEKTCPSATFVHHKIPHDQTSPVGDLAGGCVHGGGHSGLLVVLVVFVVLVTAIVVKVSMTARHLLHLFPIKRNLSKIPNLTKVTYRHIKTTNNGN
jgi:hypothetical protein